MNAPMSVFRVASYAFCWHSVIPVRQKLPFITQTLTTSIQVCYLTIIAWDMPKKRNVTAFFFRQGPCIGHHQKANVCGSEKELRARSVIQGNNDGTNDLSCSLMIAQWQSLGFSPLNYPTIALLGQWFCYLCVLHPWCKIIHEMRPVRHKELSIDLKIFCRISNSCDFCCCCCCCC